MLDSTSKITMRVLTQLDSPWVAEQWQICRKEALKDSTLTSRLREVSWHWVKHGQGNLSSSYSTENQVLEKVGSTTQDFSFCSSSCLHCPPSGDDSVPFHVEQHGEEMENLQGYRMLPGWELQTSAARVAWWHYH